MSDTIIRTTAKGGKLRSGNPPPPGGWPGAGRPSNRFRNLCRTISEETLEPNIIPIIKREKDADGNQPSYADARQAWKDVASIGWVDLKIEAPEAVDAFKQAFTAFAHEFLIEGKVIESGDADKAVAAFMTYFEAVAG